MLQGVYSRMNVYTMHLFNSYNSILINNYVFDVNSKGMVIMYIFSIFNKLVFSRHGVETAVYFYLSGDRYLLIQVEDTHNVRRSPVQ